MKILCTGGDGYIGWPLVLRINTIYPDADIVILDSLIRRRRSGVSGGANLIPIAPIDERITTYADVTGTNNISFVDGCVTNSQLVQQLFERHNPDVILHLAHQRSAPYSMLGLDEMIETVTNNEVGILNILWNMRTYCPNAHLIKLGSFGAYAKPGVEIPEGYFFPKYKDLTANISVPFPRSATDIYHITKINDANFAYLAANKWGLTITDVMQSIVFGQSTTETILNPTLRTRFDYDAVWGTVINRFLTQTIANIPMQVYGSGHQRTGLMSLSDTITVLAHLIADPPQQGTHRVINCMTENLTINEIADTVFNVSKRLGLSPEISHNQFNPREENDDARSADAICTDYIGQFIKPESIEDVLTRDFEILLPLKHHVETTFVSPDHSW